MTKTTIILLIIIFALLCLCAALAWMLLITYERLEKWRTPLEPIEFETLNDGEEVWPGWEND